ncbi:biotin transporter BioY [Phosphitispora fastidiosa]|uniref:biotin transporter BioY n=1 Tax=Phosphitispora fastidiosa TaxID=2837202 RepID=UPI001E3F9796|nr:biotin transporter BioY [Phosphitispora fastidiosa]MBU7007833.1 biotin transport system substrate-specific component [Phosphitispora fastidiosa]
MKISVKEMALVSMFAALACAGGLILRFGGDVVVPFSILPFVTMLAGVLLGGRLGALSMMVYLVIGFLGIPVFATAPYGGVTYLVKPTAGFLFGFVGAAYVTGKVSERIGKNTMWSYIIASFAGIGVLYLVGIPYFYILMNFYLGKAMTAWTVIQYVFVPFILSDLIKAVVVSVIAVPIARQVKIRTLG